MAPPRLLPGASAGAGPLFLGHSPFLILSIPTGRDWEGPVLQTTTPLWHFEFFLFAHRSRPLVVLHPGKVLVWTLIPRSGSSPNVSCVPSCPVHVYTPHTPDVPLPLEPPYVFPVEQLGWILALGEISAFLLTRRASGPHPRVVRGSGPSDPRSGKAGDEAMECRWGPISAGMRWGWRRDGLHVYLGVLPTELNSESRIRASSVWSTCIHLDVVSDECGDLAFFPSFFLRECLGARVSM